MMRGCGRAAILAGLTLIGLTLPRAVAAAPRVKAEALVLINSASPAYRDFEQKVRPYLDNFGVPYATLDIATSPVPSAIADYALIIVGHRQIDTTGTFLDRGEQEAITASIDAGSGLVNFDNDLWTNGTSRYQFVQNVFEFTPRTETVETGVVFPATDRAGGMHYITSAHQPGEVLKTGRMSLSGFSLPPSGTSVALSGTEPFVTIAEYGRGRGVQWASYDWMTHDVLGPMHGLDDVVWRSIAWAARKPFVMQAMPPIVTMRVDDGSGPFGWAHVANEFGFKPWIGIFLSQIKENDAVDLRALVQADGATAAVHGFDANEFFFFNHHDHVRLRVGFDSFTSKLSLGGRTVSGALAIALLLLGGIAWWRSVGPDRTSRSAVAGLLFGLAALIKFKIALALPAVLFVAAIVTWRTGRRQQLAATIVAALISTAMSGAWSLGLRRLVIGPGDWPNDTMAAHYAQATQWHQAHDIPVSKFVVPHFYEFGTNAFSGLADWGVEYVGTQVAPGIGYDEAPWLRSGPYRTFEAGISSGDAPSYYTDFLTVPGHAEFDGRFFNCVTEIRDDAGYEWYPTADVTSTVRHGTQQLKRALDSRALATLFTHEYFLSGIPSGNWRAILRDITSNVARYQPIYMTMDDACQYVRALHTSSIASSLFDSETGSILTTLTGTSDVPTAFSLFTSVDGTIVEQAITVPAFAGSTQVSVSTSGVQIVSARRSSE